MMLCRTSRYATSWISCKLLCCCRDFVTQNLAEVRSILHVPPFLPIASEDASGPQIPADLASIYAPAAALSYKAARSPVKAIMRWMTWRKN
jgi:hypothetical protein